MKNNDGVIQDPREIGRRFGQLRVALENGLASAMAQIMPNETSRKVVVRRKEQTEVQIDLFVQPSAPSTKSQVEPVKPLARQHRAKHPHNLTQEQGTSWIEHSLPEDKD